MRRFQRKRILELLDTLWEVQSAHLYADAQDGAAALVEYIENIAGEGTKTASLLETYCELLFKVHQGELGEEILQEHLGKITCCVRGEFKADKLEIVFLPYQLAMFDSFESIYLAAKKDPDCDVYCIPIPWYERNSDGGLGTLHYDGDQYPAYVDVIDYREYDLEKRRPDVIFVHNPYDARNYVSSIHPYFYGENLHKYADLICYIAYFLPTNLDGSCSVATAESTMVYPADLFIAQSEAEKKRLLDENGCADVVALGSPKIDRILNALKDIEIPKSWIEKVPDIIDKKVVMLNSSLDYLLEYNQEYLDRLSEYMTAVALKLEFALVWRPHPLMMTTLKSMRPALLKQYQGLLTFAQESPRIIIDENPSFLEAMLLSAAYIGETDSSIARLYTVTGKPLFTTCMERVQHRDRLDGGLFIFDYPETEELSIGSFLEKLLNGEIPQYNSEQVNYQKNIFVNCDGTAGEHIYQYIKNRYGGE